MSTLALKPWRWSRWAWTLLVPAVLATYFLSAVPVLHLLVMNHMRTASCPAMTADVVVTFYQPVWSAAEQVPAANFVLDWQHLHMFQLSDPPMGSPRGGTVVIETPHGRTNLIDYPGTWRYRGISK